ncbi:MAG: hypothetical protein ACRDTD_22745, partial [Pseudonocardiaceae bacterium]
MEWDPAKLVILAHRFGEPANAEPLLAYWPAIHPDRLADCVTAKETLIVEWLVHMADQGVAGAGGEARRRAAGLGATNGAGPIWRHLPSLSTS